MSPIHGADSFPSRLTGVSKTLDGRAFFTDHFTQYELPSMDKTAADSADIRQKIRYIGGEA